jgi:hypothetical protein
MTYFICAMVAMAALTFSVQLVAYATARSK